MTFTLESSADSPGYGLVVTRQDGTRFETIAEIRREWKATQKLAELEKRRAEQERDRAEQERKRAEALAAKLRALGVNPDDIG